MPALTRRRRARLSKCLVRRATRVSAGPPREIGPTRAIEFEAVYKADRESCASTDDVKVGTVIALMPARARSPARPPRRPRRRSVATAGGEPARDSGDGRPPLRPPGAPSKGIARPASAARRTPKRLATGSGEPLARRLGRAGAESTSATRRSGRATDLKAYFDGAPANPRCRAAASTPLRRPGARRRATACPIRTGRNLSNMRKTTPRPHRFEAYVPTATSPSTSASTPSSIARRAQRHLEPAE